MTRNRLEEFSTRLTEAIKSSGYSRAEVAEQLGLEAATIKSWCVGRRSPTVGRLIKFCEIVAVDPMELLRPLESTPARHVCEVCGRSFRKLVGYRIHMAQMANHNAEHAALLTV